MLDSWVVGVKDVDVGRLWRVLGSLLLWRQCCFFWFVGSCKVALIGFLGLSGWFLFEVEEGKRP
jgi:hypothetical protein